MLDAADAVEGGAGLLATARVHSVDACQRACCSHAHCNLVLLEPRVSADQNRSCVLFNCVHRNRFVCRFVNQPGYQTHVTEDVYLSFLQGPPGPGEQAPPIAIAGRDVVVQPGATVTLNGIESLSLGDAHITDYTWRVTDGGAGVNMEKTDLPDQVRLTDLQPGSYRFQLTVTDSNRRSHAAGVTVLVLDPQLTALFCLAPEKAGPCRAAFQRWRYNAAAGDCRPFVFGGCKPNHNNYLSKNECVSACSGVTVTSERSAALPAGEVCGSECGVGQLTCSSGCCLHRSLECDGVNHCSDASDERHCDKLNETFSRLLDVDVNQRTARCIEPPHTGPCRAAHARWYYDPLNTRCHRFTYGGCHGNQNNFDDEDKCSKTCAGVNESHVFARGMFERFEDEESDSGSVALAVVLSVAILALLAVLSYCFVKSRRERRHQPAATGPAHMAPSEQDTLVYSSTTKPM